MAVFVLALSVRKIIEIQTPRKPPHTLRINFNASLVSKAILIS
jgi:hypothetical protein